jgi:uncharacterized membrane protein required for colicin V production
LTVLDIILLSAIAVCAIYGAKQGLIRELSHIVAFGLGIFLAVKLHGTAARLLLSCLPSHTATVAAFVGLLLLVVAAIYVVFSYVKSTADKLKLGPADHVVGAVFGAVQGAFVSGVIIFVLINFSSTLPESYLRRSRVASFLLDRSAAVSEAVANGCVSKVKSMFTKKPQATDGCPDTDSGNILEDNSEPGEETEQSSHVLPARAAVLCNGQQEPGIDGQ